MKPDFATMLKSLKPFHHCS